jgi:acyl-coenzyme A thioesterase PaaI-like protein
MQSGGWRLSDEIRELIEVVRTADVTDEEARRAAEAIRSVTDDLRPRVVEGVRMQAFLHMGPDDAGVWRRSDFGLDLVGRDPTEVFPYSPVVGRLNPVAPPCRLWCVEGEPSHEVAGEVVLGAAFAGPPDSVHGGFVSSILDEVLGGACGVNGLGGFTGTLIVRYRVRAPLHETLDVRGRVTGVERRKVFASGELRHGDTVCAEAEGTFIRADVPGDSAQD